MSSSQWVRIDVGYLRNPKVRRVGRDGRDLHLAAILYLGEHRINSGLLPAEALELVVRDAGIKRPGPVVESLVKHGLWHCEPLTGGYVVHDYDTTNGNAAEASEAAKERKRRWKERHAGNGDGP